MPPLVQVRVSNWVSMLDYLGLTQQRLQRPLRVLAGPLADAVRQYFAQRFLSEGSYGGGSPWAQLAPATVKTKPYGAGILRRTDALWASLTEPNATGAYALVSEGELAVGSSLKHGEFHQLGTRNMPQRQIIPDAIPDDIVAGWATLLADSVVGGLEGES